MSVFTDDQVKSINAYQSSGVMHPFTCGVNGCEVRVLTATPEGMVCTGCGYRQGWAGAWMADWSWARQYVASPMHRAMVERGLASVGMTLADLDPPEMDPGRERPAEGR